jgi:hypothetical protein
MCFVCHRSGGFHFCGVDKKWVTGPESRNYVLPDPNDTVLVPFATAGAFDECGPAKIAVNSPFLEPPNTPIWYDVRRSIIVTV